mgnify:CR=1 FL=1
MMNWLKLHHDARTDKKLATLSDSEFRVWFNLLCMASESKERGTVLFSDMELLAIEVSFSDDELLQSTLKKLSKLRIIQVCESGVVFLSWEARQYDNPSDAPSRTAERKRNQREKERLSRQDEEMSRDVTTRHDTDKTRQDKTRTEKETDDRQEETPSKNGQIVESSVVGHVSSKQFVEETLREHPEWIPRLEQLRAECIKKDGAIISEWGFKADWCRKFLQGVGITPFSKTPVKSPPKKTVFYQGYAEKNETRR